MKSPFDLILSVLILCFATIFSPSVFAVTHYVSNHVDGFMIEDHANPDKPNTLQSIMNLADEGDEVIMQDDEIYNIQGPLFIRNGITLSGKYASKGYEKQKIKVVNSHFPADRAMITMQSGTKDFRTVLRNIHADGAHIAWRIVESHFNSHDNVGAKSFDIINNKLEKTKNVFLSPDGGDYRSPRLGSKLYMLSIIYMKNAKSVNVSGNVILDAGLSDTFGKVGGLDWYGFSDGIYAIASDGINISNNMIKNTLTAGIRITGSRNVAVTKNTMSWVARNVEWTEYDQNVTPPFSDGITGYHNQGVISEFFGRNRLNDDMKWVISENNIYHSGNNGIHVGGRGVRVDRNNIVNSVRVGIYAGDWRSTEEIKSECTRDFRVYFNRVVESGQQENVDSIRFKWRTPDSMHPFNVVEHGRTINIRGYGPNRNGSNEDFDKSTVNVFKNTLDDEGPRFDSRNKGCG